MDEIRKHIIALDIGGTKINGALSDFHGSIIFRKKIPTEAGKGAGKVLKNIYAVIDDLLKKSKDKGYFVEGIGISTFGQLDHINGVIKYATDTIPDWAGFKLKEIIEEKFNINTVIENDAYCAAWGEVVFGSARNCKDIIILTLGTGIGGAFLTKGKLYDGSNGYAGLIGHTSIEPYGHDCNCGGTGCIESYASGWGLVKVFKEFAKKKYGNYPEKFIENPDARYIFSLKDEDEVALETVKQMSWRLGTTIGSLITLLNPELVVIGGGLANVFDQIYNDLMISIKAHSTPVVFEEFKLKKSDFPDDMGLMGAIALISKGPIPRIV
jgi:glucokinase